MESAAFSTVLAALLLVQGVLIFFLAWRAKSVRQSVPVRINRRALTGLMALGALNALLFAVLLAARLPATA